VARKDTVMVGVVALVLLALLGGVGWLLWPHSNSFRVARATVLQTAPCGPADAKDAVRVDLPDGPSTPARLDGCGNLPGEVLSVEVPDPLPPGPLVVRLAGTGVSAAETDVQRISAVLVIAAGLAGAGLAWRVRHERR
jgi:hypothetical protein